MNNETQSIEAQVQERVDKAQTIYCKQELNSCLWMFIWGAVIAGYIMNNKIENIKTEYERKIQNAGIESLAQQDFNKDGLQDIGVILRDKSKQIYFGTNEGKYLTTEQIKESQISKIQEAYNKQLREIGNQYKATEKNYSK